MAQLYDRTVAELMAEAAAGLEYPATRNDVVVWFAEHYPKVKASTVRAHIIGLTDNDNSRHHYRWLAARDPLFIREPNGTLRPFDQVVEEDVADDDEQDDLADATIPRLEFALEAFLEEFLVTNWDAVNWGRPLELWESESGEPGHQLSTPVGRLDFLCRDTASEALVVIELKRGRPSDRVVGQAARYMGWVRSQIAQAHQRVEGIIVAHEQDLQLAYAVSAVPDLSILTYKIDFTLSPPEPLESRRIPSTRAAEQRA